MNLTSRTSFLVYLAHLNPRLWEVLYPHVPVISEGTRHVMASMVIKSVTKEIKDPNIAIELQLTGKSLFESGAKSMSYDDDDWCPTLPPHHFKWPEPQPWLANINSIFGPHPEPWRLIFGGEDVMLNPQPLPPREQTHYGALLTLLADAVSISEQADVLRNIGYSLMKQSSKEIYENDSSNIPSYSGVKAENVN